MTGSSSTGRCGSLPFMAKKTRGAQVSVRKRAPWKPEKGQYVRPLGTRLAIPERLGFAIVLAVVIVVLIMVLG